MWSKGTEVTESIILHDESAKLAQLIRKPHGDELRISSLRKDVQEMQDTVWGRDLSFQSFQGRLVVVTRRITERLEEHDGLVEQPAVRGPLHVSGLMCLSYGFNLIALLERRRSLTLVAGCWLLDPADRSTGILLLVSLAATAAQLVSYCCFLAALFPLLKIVILRLAG